jgi:putative oxidoreductase
MTMRADVSPQYAKPTFARAQREPQSLTWVVPVARVLFALIFVKSGFGHFSPQAAAYAASQGVPLATVLVPIAGLMAVAGGLSVMLGFKTRIGAALLVLFLVPVTLAMHQFWAMPDAQSAMIQQVMFLKNVSMLGGALLMLYFGAGPFSVDERQRVAD